MAASTDPRPNAAETLIALTIGGSYWLWLIGGLYMAGPALGWILTLMAMRSTFFAPVLPRAEQPAPLPLQLWFWLLGMGAMLVILIIAHLQFGLGFAQTAKSATGWAKGWALLALYPVAGYMLPVRMAVLARAVCRLGRQTLLLLPLFLAAPYIGLPTVLWVSPLKVLGGASDEFFAVVIYTIDPEVGLPRWQFFTPWSPAAGAVAMIHFLVVREERDARWRWTGYAASVLMALLSQSRMALVALAVIIPLAALARWLGKALIWFVFAPVTLVASWFLPQILDAIDQAQSRFAGARVGSSRVRAALGRIAVERWQHEAYWFGHGVVETGPHLVEHMPIGSHHSWYGLLFVKGLTGLLSLALPMVFSLLACVVAASRDAHGQLALSIILTLWLYSFGENLEILIYIIWPGLLAVGIALREHDQHSRRPRLPPPLPEPAMVTA